MRIHKIELSNTEQKYDVIPRFIMMSLLCGMMKFSKVPPALV